MRKLFIGCGILVALGLGVVGYFAYQIVPHFLQAQTQWAAGMDSLNALEERYPFEAGAQTQLDPRRFSAMLDARVALDEFLGQIMAETDALLRPKEEGEPIGFVDRFAGLFRTAGPFFEGFAARLEAEQMSWPEYAWHTRVLWACLRRVDGGADEPALVDLSRDAYRRMKAQFDVARRSTPQLKTLDELLDNLPPGVVTDATAVLAGDPERVRRGLRILDFEVSYMHPVSRLEDFALLQNATLEVAEGAPDAPPR